MPIAANDSKCFESVKLIDKEKRWNAFLGSVTLASSLHFICQVSATRLAFFGIYFFYCWGPLIIINRWRCAHSVSGECDRCRKRANSMAWKALRPLTAIWSAIYRFVEAKSSRLVCRMKNVRRSVKSVCSDTHTCTITTNTAKRKPINPPNYCNTNCNLSAASEKR